MSAADAAQEILRREQASPGSVPPALLAKATQLAGGTGGGGGPGTMTLPEQTITGDPREPTFMQQIFGRAGDPPGRAEQFLKKGTEAAFVGGNEYANAALLGLPQATGMTPGKDTPGYGALRADHPIAALGGQAAGLMNPANPANLAASAVTGPLRAAVGGSLAGRALAGGVEGAVAGGTGSGAITAAGGGSGDQIFNSAATGAGVGGTLGAAGTLLMEPGRFVKSLFAGRSSPSSPTPGNAGPDNNQAIIDAMRVRALAPPPKPLVPSMGELDAPAPQLGPPRPPQGLQQAPPPSQLQVPDLPVPGSMLGPERPPPGLQQAPPLDLPDVPDLQVPPSPVPVASAAPHAPIEPAPDMSTVHRPRPGDTGMGADEARRALDTDALHMANRSAAVRKLTDIIPPGADSEWLGRMTADEKARLADFVGVTQAGEETWQAVGDVLNSRLAPSIARATPRAAMASRAGQRGMIDSHMLLAGVRALRGQQSAASFGLDPSIEMMLQSRPLTNAAGMAAGTKLPAATNRQPGQPLDLLNLYGM